MELLTRALRIMTDTITYIQGSNDQLAQVRVELMELIELKTIELQGKGKDVDTDAEILALRRVAGQITDVVKMVDSQVGL